MAGPIPDAVDTLFKSAVACNDCFSDIRLKRSQIDLAQPRWIGARYWSSRPRVVIVLENPGAGNHRDGRADKEFKQRIVAYRDGKTDIQPVFDHQRRDMEHWGDLHSFYMQGFGLEFNEIAFVNVAWCGEDSNKPSRAMLNHCFDRFSGTLLRLLNPHVFILGGRSAQRFESRLRSMFPRAEITSVLHYAHRRMHAGRRPAQIKQVREVISRAREGIGPDSALSALPLR
jgi:uracil-DNA glycosylase